MQTQADNVIACFESIDHATEITGESKTNWYNWRRAGVIPHNKHLSILTKARAAGIKMIPSVFSQHLEEALIHAKGEDEAADTVSAA